MIDDVPRIKTDIQELWIEDGILYAKYLKPLVVDLNLAKEGFKCRTEISNGKRYPFLADGRNVKYWTKEAKELHTSPEYAQLLKAVALVINSPILRILAEFYKRFYAASFPIEIFTEVEPAKKWLEQFRDEEES